MFSFELLRNARDLIKDPVNWCQNEWAVNDKKEPVNPSHPEARQWCAMGAFDKVWLEACLSDPVIPYIIRQNARIARDNKAVELFGNEISTVNDNMGHDAILKVFDAAIRELEVISDSEAWFLQQTDYAFNED